LAYIHYVPKNVTLFIFGDIFVRFYPTLLIFGRNIPQEIYNKHIYVAQFTSGFTFSYGTLLLVMQRTLRRWTLSVRLVTEQECRNFFKRLFKLFTFQPSSENLRINFSTPKPLNLYKFPIKMQTSASSGCCVIWSGLVCTSVSSPRQSGMWRGRLRACVRTDGRDFKHMLG